MLTIRGGCDFIINSDGYQPSETVEVIIEFAMQMKFNI